MPDARGVLRGHPAVRAAIVAHARRDSPRECCGLLLGDRGSILFALPMANVAPDPVTRFRVDDQAHLDVRRLLRRLAPPLSIVGVYHSHPNGAARPSRVDAAEAHYPDWIYVIAGLTGARADVRAYRIGDGRTRGVRVVWRAPGAREIVL